MPRRPHSPVIALLLLLAASLPVSSQTMTTLVPDFPGNDGLSVDSNGVVYVNARGISYNGRKVIRVEPGGTYTSYATGLDPFPVGNVFDGLGNLYVTGANLGTVRRIAPDGSHSMVVDGLPGAGGLEFDDTGNLYCSAFNGNYVARIAPDLTVTTFATGGLVNGPTGLAFHAPTGVLYNANWFDGNVTRYELDGSATLFATIPQFPVGPLVIVGNYLYASTPNANRVYRIELSTGTVSIFAGTGVAGDLDGDLSVAQLRNPIGIGATHDGNMLFISDIAPSGKGRLRRVHMTDPTGAQVQATGRPAFALLPNPTNGSAIIRYALESTAHVDVAIYDVAGRLVSRLVSRTQGAGLHSLTWSGTGRGGVTAPAGVYNVRLSVDGMARTSRLVRVR